MIFNILLTKIVLTFGYKYRLKMLVLKLFLLLAFMGSNVSAYPSTLSFSDTEHYNPDSTNSSFFYNNSPIVNKQSLKIENFLLRYNRPVPKVNGTLSESNSSISILEQSKVRFLYLKYSQTIDFKLASFCISYPFHSFP